LHRNQENDNLIPTNDIMTMMNSKKHRPCLEVKARSAVARLRQTDMDVCFSIFVAKFKCHQSTK